MKIAQVSPLFESVPPKKYGGTERVVSYLTEELVRRNHDVTLFASGDSVTQATLVSPIAQSMRAGIARPDWLAYHTIQMDQVANMAAEFDIIHFHCDYLHFALAARLGTPHVTTFHGRLDLPELAPVTRHFNSYPLISISDSQRRPLPWANWLGTVYHGLPEDLYAFEPKPDDYFAFIGRASPEKGLDRAIRIALECDMPLVIGAKVDQADEVFFNARIKPMLDHPLITFLGEVNDSEKHALMSRAKALLFPIDWPEPFGLVMIEAFACGTPVIAYRHGSTPEIMVDGVTGFVVENHEEAVAAARRIDEIDRRQCRQVFEDRFTVKCMAGNYLRMYRQAAGLPEPTLIDAEYLRARRSVSAGRH